MPPIVFPLIGASWLIILFLNYCLAFPPVPLLSFLAWPSFSIGKHLFVSLINGAWLLFFVAAAYGYVDAVIEPNETRNYLTHSLTLAQGKMEITPKKKHGVPPF